MERDTSGRVHLAARKLIDLSAQPDRLSMWICEVVEARMRERGSAQGGVACKSAEYPRAAWPGKRFFSESDDGESLAGSDPALSLRT